MSLQHVKGALAAVSGLGVKGAAWQVLFLLCFWADASGHVNAHKPSVAKCACIDEKTVYLALRLLKRLGLVVQVMKARQHRSARYRVLPNLDLRGGVVPALLSGQEEQQERSEGATTAARGGVVPPRSVRTGIGTGNGFSSTPESPAAHPVPDPAATRARLERQGSECSASDDVRRAAIEEMRRALNREPDEALPRRDAAP